MKAKYERWLSREALSLRELYARLDKEELEERYGRSVENIRHKARKLGVKKRAKRFKWQKWEDQLILENVKIGPRELSKLLTRSQRAIDSRFRKLRNAAKKTT